MPEPALQATALRYAAGDLSPDEVATFEARLADDQDARDALAEAVRLSAAAIGQSAPKPHASFRATLRARISWERYQGRPLAWAGAGAAVVAVCTLVGLSLANRNAPRAPERAVRVAPAVPAFEVPPPPKEPDVLPDAREPLVPAAAEPSAPAACGGGEPHRSVAEIWADLSTPEHVEKTRDDEARLRHKMHSLAHPHHVSTANKADAP